MEITKVVGFCIGVQAEFAYKSVIHKTIGKLPFFVIYMKAPQHDIDLIKC